MKNLSCLVYGIGIVTLVAGCGSRESDNLIEVEKSDSPLIIASIVESFSDKVGSPAFVAAFVEDAKPTAQQEKMYLNLNFEVVETPDVRGDNAKVKVKITPMIRRTRKTPKSDTESTQNSESVVEWELTKTPEGWKIRSAPVKS